MKAGLLGLAAAGVVAASAGSAPAQYVYGGPVVYRPVPVYTAPVLNVGFGFGNGGFGVGGFYSTFPSYGYYRPAVVYPSYGWGGYYRSYYGGYSGGYHHHHHGYHHW